MSTRTPPPRDRLLQVELRELSRREVAAMLDAGAVGLQLLACQRGATELATRGRLATDLVELGAHVSPNGYLDRLRALVDSTDPRRQLAVVHSWINVPLEQP